MRKVSILLFILFIIIRFSFAQVLTRIDSFKVISNGVQLKNAWAGGINFPQFSSLDLNLDGIKDVVVFDRSGNKIIPFLNQGIADSISYLYKPQYVSFFPSLHDWALFVDYNCDGKEDIFSYSSGGMAVYKNTSTTQLNFTKVNDLLYSDYNPNFLNLYVSSVDLPAITDVDGDGDTDILTFGIGGTTCEFHKNMSKELYGSCDSLKFIRAESCWGNFTENFSNNGVTLNAACKNRYMPFSVNKPNRSLHSGSTLLAFDNDCDGDKELLLGDISFSNMNFLVNGGDALSANITGQDATFPSNDVPVNVYIFPAGFQLDVTNDGLKDLVAGANAANASQNNNSAWLYKNTGNNCAPNYKYRKSALLQDEMIDLGEGAYPVFFDYDNDGLMDIAVGNYGFFISAGNYRSSVALYKNIGTSALPKFQLITFDFGVTSAMNKTNMYPTFGDIDGDGDKDMIVGDFDGKLHLFQNSAGPQNPANISLFQANITNSNGTVIDVGQFATPQLVDVNRDGLLDLLVGSRNGNVLYYQNVGTTSNYLFTLKTNSFGGVDVRQRGYTTGYSAPFLLIDNGVSRLYVGCERGFIFYYDNIDGNLTGTFNKVDSTFADIKEGVRTSVSIARITNSNEYSWLIGNYGGGIGIYSGYPTVLSGMYKEELSFDVSVFPNPANDVLYLLINTSINAKHNFKGKIVNMLGEEMNNFSLLSNNSQIDISNLAQGSYSIIISNENKKVVKKMMITR